MTLFGDGEDSRDYLYVEDIYQVILRTIEEKLSDVVNVASGKSYSIREIIQLIESAAKVNCLIDLKETPPLQEQRIKNMQFNPQKLNKLLKFKVHDVTWGIAQYLENLSVVR